jgi:beta-glucosidase
MVLLLLLVCVTMVMGFSPVVEDLLKRMSLRQKVGQMTQLELALILKDGSKTELDPNKMQKAIVEYGVGSFLNSPYSGSDTTGGLDTDQWIAIINQIQAFAVNNTDIQIPIIYGLDSLHGANYIMDATLFPQNLGLAATFNLELARQSGYVTAKETRAAGVHWIFGPDVENFLTPLWPRAYETFGEDPYVCAQFGSTITAAMQGSSLADETTAAACLKHYLGYGNPRTGKDRTDAWIPDSYLRQYFVPSFKAAIEAGAATIMVNSGSINGVPVHASYDLLTNLLRSELNFQGVLVTDWEDIKKLVTYHRLTPSEREATKISVLAGIDMSMVPLDYSFSDHLYDLVLSGEITEARIDLSVGRILELKEKLGLIGANKTGTLKPAKRADPDPADRLIALEAARESLTLAKNSGVLPLSWLSSGNTILVTGPAADSVVNLCGGWTIHWQGMLNDNEIPYGSSIYDGFRSVAPQINTVYKFGCSFDYCDSAALEEARVQALSSNVIVMAIGEAPMAESLGNIDDVFIGQGQVQLYQTLRSTGKPIVTVVVAGRPRVLGPLDASDAILLAYLPCAMGGQAIAEVLMGNVNPSGKVPFSYPRTTGDLDVYYHKPWGTYSQGTTDPFHDPIFPFGFGMSYTSFQYSGLSLSLYSGPVGVFINVFVRCTNTGNRYGKEVALFYIKQQYRLNITPEDKLLKNFQKFGLDPGQSIDLMYTITPDDVAYYFKDDTPIIEPGTYTVLIADLKADFVLQ